MGIRARLRGFTLIELMIVVAVVAVIVTLAAPSFRDMILMQRLKGINAQLVTDMAFARSEATSRNTYTRVAFAANTTMSCYIISAGPNQDGTPSCDCLAAAGSRCTGIGTEDIRTVQLPSADSVIVAAAVIDLFSYVIDPRTGGIVVIGPDGPEPGIPDFVVNSYIDSSRKFRDTVGKSGRVTVCSPAGSPTGADAC